jgi:hypothetical protein
MPVIGLIDPRSPYLLATPAQGFRQGLKDTGYIDGRRARADAAPNCSNAELPAIVVYYGSEPGFLGTDTFILEVQGEGSAPSLHKFNVTVAGMIQ